MDRAIANTVRFTRLPIDAVMKMASTIPADYLGLATGGTGAADWDPDTAALHVRRVME